MYKKNCKICDCVFEGKGPAALYCEVHAIAAKAAQAERNRLAVAKMRAATGKIKRPGSGKGGNPRLAEDHPSYKHGWYIADRLRSKIKARGNCERCDLDLSAVDRWHWVVHHRDHNHCNNVLDNLELLCKRCHQVEHECHLAFTKGATTRA